MRITTASAVLYMLLAGFVLPASSLADNPLILPSGQVDKLVFLTIEQDRYIVSDIRANRFVEIARKAQEKLIDSAEAKQVVVIATNQRYLAYSSLVQGWRELRTQAGERVIEIRAEDYAALVTTSQRLLSFNGASGSWAEFDR